MNFSILAILTIATLVLGCQAGRWCNHHGNWYDSGTYTIGGKTCTCSGGKMTCASEGAGAGGSDDQTPVCRILNKPVPVGEHTIGRMTCTCKESGSYSCRYSHG